MSDGTSGRPAGVRYFCCDELRRNAIAGHATLNAIDYLEVADLAPAELDAVELAQYNALPVGERDRLLWMRRLSVRFVNPLTAQHVAGLTANTLAVAGGERIRGIRLDVLTVAAGGTTATLRSSTAGDFSRYRLSIVRSAVDPRPPAGFDPVLSTIDFSFRVDCPSGFDCRRIEDCPVPPVEAPRIDYLAKDYASFRRLILDRLALLVPDWRERNPADLGITLVELLAHVGDQLSYQQDAVATEAYLETARRRVSIRRHALLVDYPMHDGCNARVWLHLTVDEDTVVAPSDLRFFTRVQGLADRILPASPDEMAALDAGVEWFEPVVPSLDPDAPADPISLFADHDELSFYTWGDDRCCLPRGATRAMLAGHHEALEAGMLLLVEETKGPRTGDPADADPGHRHVVRLTRVVHTEDGAPLADPLDGTEITAIEWGDADALPFPLCISARTDVDDLPIADVSVARGNIILVDHGRSVTEDLGAVPAARLSAVLAGGGGSSEACERLPRRPVPPRFRPPLRWTPVTQTGTVLRQAAGEPAGRRERVRFDPSAPASAAFDYALRDVRPAVTLASDLLGATTPWIATRDLLSSAADAPAFVVETEHDGATVLRFGDDENGLRPRTDEAFSATYRAGNGAAGNVGAGAIAHVVTADGRIAAVRNPLAAHGGTDPEPVEQVRRRAPQAFRSQERAVTRADYERVTTLHPASQRAAATLRWTGTWHTVFLTVDRFDGKPLDRSLEAELAGFVERYRMAGHDLEFDDPRFVSLEVELFVCVEAESLRSDVKDRLLDVLSSRTLADGRRGLFHPDNFTFGQTIYLSPILAAARDVPGVASAEVVTFQRQGIDDKRYLDDGRLPLGRLEIARLRNDPNFPEHGVLRLELGGGK